MSLAGGAGGTPRTTTTFLFTDIESHTQLWQANPDAMSEALAAHETVIGDAVSAAGGRVVKYGGDAAMAVFDDAAAAVDAARAAQLTLSDTDWPGVGILRVRIGLHIGAAYERDGDYYGPEVIRAARLCDAAHGQQILASGAIAALTPSSRWLDLGEHHLRGLDAAERVHQLAGPGLRTNFPPLRSVQRAHDRLPHPRTSFVGRVDELVSVERELATHRLVTLTGVGGSGKTRLAIEAARAALKDHPDGAEFVDLSTVTDENGVYPAVAAALDLQATQGVAEPLIGRVRSYLARRRAIVVIDNCEHLLDAVAELVDDLLQHCEHVRILATSREPLRVEDEKIIQVGSLDLEGDAVALFRDRAEGPVDGAATVMRICERLDGIPLAIELAASRTSHLSVDDIAERLDDRFRLLTGGRRRVQRQQTLQATLDWSHDLLTPDERMLLRRLAVFAGPFPVYAVEGICSDHADIIGVLGALVERNMVNHNPAERRYRLLETVRLYAEQKLLEAGETDQYRRRHREWFRTYVCSLPFEECFFECDTSRRLVADIDDLRAAVRWSASTGDTNEAAEIATRLPIAAVLVGSDEVARWATELVPLLAPESDLAFHCFLAGFWNGSATVDRAPSRPAGAPRAGYLTSLSALLGQLAALAEARTDDISVFARALIANTQYGIGVAVGDVQTARTAERLADDAVEMAESRPPSAWTGYARAYAAMVALGHGDVEAAAGLLRQCIATGDELVSAAYEPVLAVVLHALGDPDAYELAMRAQERAELPATLVTAAVVAALELASSGDQPAAHKELRSALPELPRTVTMIKTMMLIGAAGVAIYGDDHRRAARWLASASGVGGIFFTTPPGFLLYQRFIPLVRETLPRDERHLLRDQGLSLPLDDALDELTRWVAE